MLNRLCVLGLLGVGLICSGCTARVTAPEQVKEPERVWLLQFPIHPSLVFNPEANRFVMYEYGEWAWFAEERTHWSRFFPVFLWPTQGSLSRRELSLNLPSGTTVTSRTIRLAFMADQTWAIDVEREQARLLFNCLEDRYKQSPEKPLYRADLDTWFVKDDLNYHALRTCHEVMTSWLRELDCNVRGPLWNLRWTVQESPDLNARDTAKSELNAGK